LLNRKIFDRKIKIDFRFIKPLLDIGYTRPLQIEDFSSVGGCDDSERVCDQLEKLVVFVYFDTII